MPDWIAPIIGLIGVVIGVGITEFRYWRENKERYRILSFEKRLTTYQEALSQIYRMRRDVYSGNFSEDEKDDSIKTVIKWWEENQLLLDDASRRQMQVLFDAAYNLIERNDSPGTFHHKWRETRETIYKGIGTKHLPDTTFKEETEVLVDSKVIDDKKKVVNDKASKKLSIKRVLKYWLAPVWYVLIFNLGLFLLGLTATHFDWAMSIRLLRVLLPISDMLLVLGYVSLILIPRWPLESGLGSIFIMSIVYLFAAVNENNASLQLRAYLNKSFDPNYLGISMTLVGVLIALWAIYNQEKKQKRK